jgi:hypothetical protein
MQVVVRRTGDDDRVVADEDVADALAVGKPSGLVVHAKREVVEESLRDLGAHAGDDQFQVVVGGDSDGAGERDVDGRPSGAGKACTMDRRRAAPGRHPAQRLRPC